jgi:four helix bundle protein
VSRDFRKIVAWQKADDLAVAIYRITEEHFPPEERFGLTAQLRAAAVSVAANIAEGSGRGGASDFRRFLHVAQGSLAEVEYYIHLARRLRYLDGEGVQSLDQQRQEGGRTLNGLIQQVGRQIASRRRVTKH